MKIIIKENELVDLFGTIADGNYRDVPLRLSEMYKLAEGTVIVQDGVDDPGYILKSGVLSHKEITRIRALDKGVIGVEVN